MMTVGQHDSLWMAAFEQVPSIASSLRRANALTVMKELYEMGEMSKDEYIKAIVSIAKSEGFVSNHKK